jgi:hypothetical protein
VSEGVARDKTEDWLLPERARPQNFAELEARIEYAVAVARSSEGALAEIGAVAIEAAEQSRRAAELAERAALAAEQAARGGVALAEMPVEAALAEVPAEPALAEVPAGVAPANGSVLAGAENPAVYPLPPAEDLLLAHFMERADRVVERLRALEQLAG